MGIFESAACQGSRPPMSSLRLLRLRTRGRLSANSSSFLWQFHTAVGLVMTVKPAGLLDFADCVREFQWACCVSFESIASLSSTTYEEFSFYRAHLALFSNSAVSCELVN